MWRPSHSGRRRADPPFVAAGTQTIDTTGKFPSRTIDARSPPDSTLRDAGRVGSTSPASGPAFLMTNRCDYAPAGTAPAGLRFLASTDLADLVRP